MVAGKLSGERRPHIACLSISVKQDDGRSLSTDPYRQGRDRQGRAVRSDVLNFEIGRKRMHICGGGHQHTFLGASDRRRQFWCLHQYATAFRRMLGILWRGGSGLSFAGMVAKANAGELNLALTIWGGRLHPAHIGHPAGQGVYVRRCGS